MRASLGQRLRKGLWVVLGSIFLAIGIIGIVVPLLPTTPFLLLAAGCYAKGSKTLSKLVAGQPLARTLSPRHQGWLAVDLAMEGGIDSLPLGQHVLGDCVLD